ncbi:hypothetical protein ACFQJ7_15605 [Halovenus rubra]|uniref:Uncharacterized protein n=2 Tax=Halovenus rubra TaxID=869890 RepID=A0ACC7E0L7_9EURY|nr:hypothetical protein [Halovenus rubra]
MSDSDSDPELSQLLTDLTTTLRELEQEVESERPRGPRLPTPSELSRFTSEVAIPGIILVLRTNVRALQLLQRAVRLADGRKPSPDGAVSEARSRAEEVGKASLSQLDGVLTDLQTALESRPENEQADELLSRARELREQVQGELAEDETQPETQQDSAGPEIDQSDAVGIDVESELKSLKDNIQDAEQQYDDDGDDGDDGDDSGSDATDDTGSDPNS